MRKGWFLTRCALGERSCRSRVCSVKHSSVDESCCGEFGKLFVMMDVMIFKPGCVFERTSPWFHIQYKQDICQHGWFGVNIIFKRGLYHIWLSSAVFLQNVTTADSTVYKQKHKTMFNVTHQGFQCVWVCKHPAELSESPVCCVNISTFNNLRPLSDIYKWPRAMQEMILRK